jgi:S1-C subfamily serine protease
VPLTDLGDLMLGVFDKKPGTAVKLEVIRDGKTFRIEARLGARPKATRF